MSPSPCALRPPTRRFLEGEVTSFATTTFAQCCASAGRNKEEHLGCPELALHHEKPVICLQLADWAGADPSTIKTGGLGPA